MFRARKSVEASVKRTGTGLLSTDVLSASKRQRLEYWDALYAPRSGNVDDAEETSSLLVDSRDCTIVEGAKLPPQVLDELQKEWPNMSMHQRHQVCCCRASIPSARHRGGCHWIPYFIFPLRSKVMLWQQNRGKVITLQLPDEFRSDEVLHFFLFALNRQNLSLLVVGKSGLVLFWEDIELPYESVPLSVQIPLASNEQVTTDPSAAIVATQDEEDITGLMCWSNQGNIWEVAVEDRRIRVRVFEKQQTGFFSGITKSVSQFFFASTVSKSAADGGDVDPNQPIKYLKVLPSSMGDAASMSSSGGDVDETADMLVLFQDGLVERRSFNIGDVMDCACVSHWHFNVNRIASSYFSDNFPEAHLAKVHIVLMPYVHELSFALLVAFVCSSSRAGTNATTKYALFQFSLTSVNRDAAPELAWVHMLDFEPYFDEQAPSRFFTVENFSITRDALYLVWSKMEPVQFCTLLLLPQAAAETGVRSTTFPLQGAEGRLAMAFEARIDQSALDSNAVKGSISFLLLQKDVKSLSGAVCLATASEMQKLERSTALFSFGTIGWKRSDVSYYTNESSRVGGKNVTVEDYMRLLLTHFHDDSNSTSTLRFSMKDVASVAQAAVGVAFQLLDAKSSSGLRWEKEANAEGFALTNAQDKEYDISSVTPKLVRYQLEEKQNRMMAFIDFLQHRCGAVWDFIENSSELQHYFIENEEKLQAAIALSKFQASILSTNSKNEAVAESQPIQRRLTGTFLLHAIEKAVEKRGYQKEQLRLAGYNSFDVFYCEVSKIAELFQLFGDEIQHLSTSIGESDPAYYYALVESGCAMLSMLCPPVQSSRVSSVPTGSWAFTREVREVVARHLSRLSTLIGYPPSDSLQQIRLQCDEVFELTDQIKRLGSVLLDHYVRFIPLASSEDADELRQEEAFAKRVMLNPLVYIATQTQIPDSDAAVDFELDSGSNSHKRADLFRQCVELCEKYCYFEGMVYLVYVEDSERLSKLDYVLGKLPKSRAALRFESYCTKHEGFDNFVFRWYNGEVRSPWHHQHKDETSSSSPSMMAYLLAQSQPFAPALHKFMKGRDHLHKYRWLTAVAIERYDQVAVLALHEAKSEQRSLSKRKTMASLAKIAALASPNLSDSKTVQDIHHELVRGKLQELLRQLPLKEPIRSQPLAPEELVNACLTAALSVEKEDPMRTNIFLMALEALDTLATDPPTEEFKEMRAGVWRSCIVDDGELWDNLAAELTAGVNEEKLESLMRETLLYKAMKEYASRPEYQEGDAHMTSALTIEVIRELVQREGNVDSAVSVQSQQLLMKTLHLALQH